MGNFVNYMYKFVADYNQSNGTMSRKKISEWFKNKKAVERNDFSSEYICGQKSAVVVVGVSCIGKSTYVQKFVMQNPGFEVISYDEACYQRADEIKSGAKTSESRLIEIIEQQILDARDRNIIVDAMCINPAPRAALLRFLADLGYEIHLIYFSQAYTEANIKKCITNRAIELALYQDYLETHDMSKMSIREIMLIRKDILEICAKERSVSVEELKLQTASLHKTNSNIIFLTQEYNEEVEENRMWWQEKRELFMLGADYYYTL